MKNAENSAPEKLDIAQWRDVFSQVDALFKRPADQRPATDDSFHHGERDEKVDSVVRHWAQSGPAHTDAVGKLVDLFALPDAGIACPAEQMQLGHYRLLERIGQGGMGSVWRAERTDGLYQSQVAIKLLGTLALSAHARARFEQEGKILARLTHQNIARLLDAGTTDDGQRYLVIELIDGVPINDYVTREKLTVDARLQLFRQLLDAVAFAHERLVIHRDIKPANIVVTATGQLKLLDFGVAKLLTEDSGDVALTRLHGAAYTEAYAAPEQMRGEPPAVGADVFSLGMILFELVTGQRASWAKAKRSLQSGDQVENLAAIMPADVRAIIGKALEVASQDRYRSVAALDDDVRRLLASEPVGAQAATLTYHARKFLQRHKLPVAFGLTAGITITASLIFALHQLSEARAEASRANQVTAFLTGLFRASDPRLAAVQDKKTLTAKQLLDSGSARVMSELNDQPRTKVALLGVLAEIFGHLGDGKKFVELNNERIRFATEKLGPTHPEALLGRFTDAEADLYSGNFADARATLIALEAPFVQVFGRKSARNAALLAMMAAVDNREGNRDASSVIDRFEQSVSIWRELRVESEGYATTLQNYSVALREGNRMEESLVEGAHAIAMMERLKDINLGNLANAYGQRATSLQTLGRHDEVETFLDKAIATYEKSYGTEHVLYLNRLLNKASWLHGRDRRAEAWELIDRVFATKRQPSLNRFGVSEQHYVKGLLLLAEDRAIEAIPELTIAVESWRSAKNNPSRLSLAEAALLKARTSAAAAAR